MATTDLHVKMPDELANLIRESAERNDRTIAGEIRRACKFYLVTQGLLPSVEASELRDRAEPRT